MRSCLSWRSVSYLAAADELINAIVHLPTATLTVSLCPCLARRLLPSPGSCASPRASGSCAVAHAHQHPLTQSLPPSLSPFANLTRVARPRRPPRHCRSCQCAHKPQPRAGNRTSHAPRSLSARALPPPASGRVSWRGQREGWRRVWRGLGRRMWSRAVVAIAE